MRGVAAGWVRARHFARWLRRSSARRGPTTIRLELRRFVGSPGAHGAESGCAQRAGALHLAWYDRVAMDSTLADPFGLVGTLLERKIRVDRVVAAGGFGVVYAGHHLGLDAPVAIKVLRPSAHGASWGEAVAQFLNEAKTIAKLRHPAVVASLDAGVARVESAAEGVPWIVLEWVDGETLQADLARRRGQGGRSRDDALALLEPVIEAIAIAHDAGIAHRDLKPSNVMLAGAPDGLVRARVLDFGIAKLMEGEPTSDAPSGDTATSADVRAFSLVCAAPQQISGTRTGPWTDVYALALLLTEVLTDRAPYPEDDAHARVAAVFDTTRPTPAKLGVDAGPWEAVLAKALSVKPADRQPNARALLAELKGARLAKSEATLASSEVRASAAPSPLVRESTTRREPARGRAEARRRWALALGAASITALAIAWGARARRAAPASDAAPSCTKSADCATDGASHAICRSGACVALESPDCAVLADARALASDDTVWIGSLFPLTGDDARSLGLANARALDVARSDFEQTMSGLASSRAGDAARPFGVVSCDDAVDPRRAAAHLVDDVGVPAIVGFRSGVEAIDLATTELLPKRVLSICATSTNPLVTRVPEPAGEARLVWRTTDDGASTAAALAAFARDVFTPDARAHGEIARDAPLRVALVRPKDALGAAFADAYVAAATKSGGAIDERAYRDLPYDFARGDDAAFAPIARALLAFRPNLVLFFGGKPAVDRVLVPLEAEWPRSLAWRPRYASVAVLGSILLDFVDADAD